MTWSELPLNPTPRMLRQFALAWLVCFLGLGIYHWLARNHVVLGMGLATLGIMGGALGLIRPPALRWLFIGATVAAFPIGWLVSQVVLWVMFYVVLVPVALWFRLRGRDLLGLRSGRERASYWEPKGPPPPASRYLRQY